MVGIGKAKQISLQINGLNIKLVKKAEKKKETGLFADQWFKLKTKHQTMTRSIKKKSRKQWKQASEVGRLQNSRTTSRAAKEKNGQTSKNGTGTERRKRKPKHKQQPITHNKEERGRGRTNFPKVIGRNEFVSLKLSHS